MSSFEMSHIDLEQGTHRRNESEVSAGEASVCFSDADEGSCYSQFYSTTGGSYDEYSFGCEIGGDSDSRRVSSASDCSVEVRAPSGANELKLHLAKVEKDCRICHLGLESNSHESGAPIELGCSCKDDLAAAHKHCAEAWFKIRGNKIQGIRLICCERKVIGNKVFSDVITYQKRQAFGIEECQL
ncbi:uncharacterized protein LOC108455880 isoform X2 [Gossypium arboreum]|uniref:Uncharacterized protein isoform X2 n=1 Tax=Gossypium hirsutum TaxID=3635 RepID=A0ABM2YQI0_GOSHI|nr:uncharacterized protein LOC107889748 isoform X2 [Gossypium hirsutum]XP_052875271.1 uncharacterized protein LOC108455880 isoform X2 [Gossypium arboreum]